MGVVYEAEQLSLGRRVALKVLPLVGMLDERQLQRFKNEARAAATLQHTNIVPVYAVGTERGVHFYAMQLVAGRSMAEVLDELRRAEGILPPKYEGQSPKDESSHLAPRDGTMCATGSASASNAAAGSSSSPASSLNPEPRTLNPLGDTVAAALATHADNSSQFAGGIRKSAYIRSVVNLAIQAAGALDHAHAEGIVHRDIKPANLILDARGRLWVTDFGLARFQADVGMTMTGDLVGTMRYMSPEQALAQRVIVDHRTDIYSLGVTLYELLTLRPTFDGADRQELLRQIAFNEPASPRKFNTAIPHDLETIVLKAIEKNPSDRYATARQLADDLEHFLRCEPIRAKRPTVLQRVSKWSRRHSALVTSCAILLLLTTIGLTTAATLLNRAYYFESAERQRAQENLKWAWDTTNDMYVQVAEKWLADEPQMEPVQREFLLKALAFFERYIEQEGDTPSAQLQVATALRRAAEVHKRFLDNEKAKTASEEAIRRLRHIEQLDSSIEAREELAKAHFTYSEALTGIHSVDDPRVVSNFRQSVELWRELVKEQQNELRFLAGLAHSTTELTRQLSYTKQLNEADLVAAEAYDVCRQLIERAGNNAENLLLLARAKEGLGARRMSEGKWQEAIEVLEEAGDNLSNALQLNARNPAARDVLCNVKRGQAGSWKMLGKPDKALELLRVVVEERTRLVNEFPKVPEYQKQLAGDYGALAYCCDDESSVRENLRLAIHWLEVAYSASPGDVYMAAFLADQYYGWLFRYGDADPSDEDRDVQHKAINHMLSMIERPEASRSKRLARNASFLAWILVTTHNSEFRQPATALRLAKWAYEVDPTPMNLNMLGTAHCEAGHHEKAVEILTKVAADPSASAEKAHPLLFLAKAHWHSGQDEKAREALNEAVQLFEKNDPANTQLVRIRDEVKELLQIGEKASKPPIDATDAKE